MMSFLITQHFQTGSGLGLRTTPSSPAIVLRSGRVTLSSCFHDARYGDEGFSLPHAQDTIPQSPQTTYHIYSNNLRSFFSCQLSREVFSTGGWCLTIHSGLGIIARTIDESFALGPWLRLGQFITVSATCVPLPLSENHRYLVNLYYGLRLCICKRIYVSVLQGTWVRNEPRFPISNAFTVQKYAKTTHCLHREEQLIPTCMCTLQGTSWTEVKAKVHLRWVDQNYILNSL